MLCPFVNGSHKYFHEHTDVYCQDDYTKEHVVRLTADASSTSLEDTKLQLILLEVNWGHKVF